jgi:regulator of protease activity HflC (stomatin/prohibitin superfamily)
LGKLIALVFVLVLALVGAVYYLTSWGRVDPGNVGILVDYSNGHIDPITETKWIWVGRYQKLIQWPAGQQVYVMERGDQTGQIKGDDSVQCITADSQAMRFDAQVDWRLDPKQITQVYALRKETPLVGPRNRDAPGNYLEDLVVRTSLRDAITKTCPQFGWSDLIGVKQLDFQNEVEQKVKEAAEPQGMIISGVTIIRPYPNDNLQGLLTARLQGQQQREQSDFAAAQAQRQQQIDQAASVAAAEKARIETEARNKLLVSNAEAEAQIARTKATQQAEATRSQGEAEADSLKAQASAVTPALVDLERAKKWNGAGPVTVIGGDPQMVNQVPLQR